MEKFLSPHQAGLFAKGGEQSKTPRSSSCHPPCGWRGDSMPNQRWRWRTQALFLTRRAHKRTCPVPACHEIRVGMTKGPWPARSGNDSNCYQRCLGSRKDRAWENSSAIRTRQSFTTTCQPMNSRRGATKKVQSASLVCRVQLAPNTLETWVCSEGCKPPGSLLQMSLIHRKKGLLISHQAAQLLLP